jgi:hypothetical protein
MRFTLIYDGELRANGNSKRKWEIRKEFAPQLEHLWRISPPLVELRSNPYVPKDLGYHWTEIHHSIEDGQQLTGDFSANPEKWVNTIEPIQRGGRAFLPLVRESLALRCAMKITFLRQEDAGRVYQGDLDNRLKTLFDALSVPNADQILDDPTAPDPMYCLLEDDALISELSVETHRLLARPNASKHEVRAVIEVRTLVSLPRSYNHRFLGD